MNTIRLGLVLLLVFFSVSSIAKSADLSMRIRNKIVTKIFNQAMSHFTEKDGYIKKHLPSKKYPLKIDLNEYIENVDQINDYTQELLGIDLKGDNKVNFFFQNPYVQGKITLHPPTFTKDPNNKDKLKVKISAEVENFYIYFKHIWFSEEGFTTGEAVGENSCIELIKRGEYKGRASINLEEEQKLINDFDAKLASLPFKKSEARIWARVDHFQVGLLPKPNKENQILKLSITASADLRPDKTTLKVEKFTHNFAKKDGAFLKYHLPEQNIVLPPIYVKTTPPLIGANGQYVKDDNGDTVRTVNCTKPNFTEVKKYVTKMGPDLTKKVHDMVTEDMINNFVVGINETLGAMSIGALPRQLEIAGQFKDRPSYETKEIFGMQVKVPKDLDVNLVKDVQRIFGDFMEYRAAVSLQGLGPEKVIKNGKTSYKSDALQVGINANLVIDGDELNYREKKYSQFINHDNFQFGRYYDDVAFALSGNLIQKLINFTKDQLIKAHVPGIVDVTMNENSYSVDSEGYIVFKPIISAKVKGYNIVNFQTKVRAKPMITHSSDKKRTYLELVVKMPSAKSIVNSIKVGKVVKVADGVVSGLLMTNPITFWLAPIKDFSLKPALKDKLIVLVDKYRKKLYDQEVNMELTNYIDDFGVKPRALVFSQSGHAALYLELGRLPQLDEAMEKVKATLDDKLNKLSFE